MSPERGPAAPGFRATGILPVPDHGQDGHGTTGVSRASRPCWSAAVITTPILSTEESSAARKKAAHSGYSAPKGKKK